MRDGSGEWWREGVRERDTKRETKWYKHYKVEMKREEIRGGKDETD